MPRERSERKRRRLLGACPIHRLAARVTRERNKELAAAAHQRQTPNRAGGAGESANNHHILREQSGREERASAPTTDANNLLTASCARVALSRVNNLLILRSLARQQASYLSCAHTHANDHLILRSLRSFLRSLRSRANDPLLLRSRGAPTTSFFCARFARSPAPAPPLPPPPRYPFVRFMMNAVAGAILAQVAWGVKARAYIGAAVSAVDGLSDAYMIKTFFDMGDMGAGKGLLAMVSANVCTQLLIVYVQTHGLKKKRWRTTLFEVLTVVTFVKPGVDAHRVASGTEQVPGASLSPLTEMMFTKGAELSFEGIPG